MSVAFVFTVAGCGEPQDADRREGLAPVPGSIGPEVLGGTYQPIELDQSVLPQNIDAEVAVTDRSVLFYGGFSESDSGQAEFAQDEGAVLDIASGHLSEIPAWPHGDPPFRPEVVAVDDRFLVVGTPCSEVAPSDGPPNCVGGVRAALFDPAQLRWEAVPAPADQLDFATDAFADAGLWGAANGIAYFTYQDGTDSMESSVLAFDVSELRWRGLGRRDGSEAVHCATGSGLVRGRIAADGGPLAERLDPETGEWRSSDGSKLIAPEPSEDGNLLSGPVPQGPTLLLHCAGDQLIGLVASGGDVQSLYWFKDSGNNWYELPAPGFESTEAPAGALVQEVLVLWPGGLVPTFAFSAGAWRTIDQVPQIRGPEIAATSDGVIVVGRESEEAPRGPQNGPFMVGRLVLDIEND